MLLFSLATLAYATRALSLSEIFAGLDGGAWTALAPSLALVVAALFGVFLAENARIPFDDPTTHLELTMIHEVMVLDHGGPDLAFIQYGSALKLWLLGSVLAGICLPVRTASPWIDAGAALLGMGLLAMVTGLIESSTARLRLTRVPQALVGAAMLSLVALGLAMR